jgi:hypothetical protein
MSDLTALETIELVPVIELEPSTFSTRERSSPAGSGRDVPDEWNRYWLDSLADSGVVDLFPLWPASWLVTTRQLTNLTVLERVLTVIVRDWGGAEALSGPDSRPVLNGGLALFDSGKLLVAPTCCCDLGNISDWRKAAAHRDASWMMLWIGHPWLSVRFESGRVILSQPHESDLPKDKWTLTPNELEKGIDRASRELENLARRLVPVLEAMGVAEVGQIARKLAGLEA